MSDRLGKKCVYVFLDFRVVIIKKGEIVEAMPSKVILMMPKNQELSKVSSKDPQGMYLPLFSLNNLVDVPSTRTDPQEMYPLLFSVTTTQVDVPSTCTTKDVPSNELTQSSQAVSPLKLFEGETKDILGG